ncbi:MAG: phytanoyl-CoA dioxygenase family protein [Acidimicrobiales bacterium]
MRLSDETLDAIRIDGFAIVEGFLTDAEVEAAQRADFDIFPEPAEYFADPSRYESLVQGQFSGLRVGPFPSWELNRLAFHPDLVDAAERYCGSTDLDLYKIELWAKYSGAVDYDQHHHRDYGNHSLVVPRADGRWPQLTTFTLLSDVSEADGPTKVVPRPVGVDAPLYPNRVGPGEFADDEVAVTGPAGTLFLYTTDVLHRASSMTGEQRSRFVLLADYAARGNPWMGKVSWPGRALDPAWPDLLAKASPRERELFGFPPVGSDYWNEQTVSDVGQRWPGIDMSVYRVR